MTKPTNRRVFLQKSFPMGTGLLVLRDSRLAFGSQKMAECARKRASKAPGGLQSWRTSFKIDDLPNSYQLTSSQRSRTPSVDKERSNGVRSSTG